MVLNPGFSLQNRYMLAGNSLQNKKRKNRHFSGEFMLCMAGLVVWSAGLVKVKGEYV